MLTRKFSSIPSRSVRRNGIFGYRAYTIIYAIDCPEFHRIKFGQTSNIAKRLRAIRNVSPAPVELIGSAWMLPETEQHIFKFLADDRCHGEWFHRTDRARSVAALLAAGKLLELAEIVGMQSFVPEDLPSNVSWGSR